MAAKQIGQPVQFRVATTGDENQDWAAAQVVAVYGVARTTLDLEISPLKQPKGRRFSVNEGTAVGNWREIPT